MSLMDTTCGVCKKPMKTAFMGAGGNICPVCTAKGIAYTFEDITGFAFSVSGWKNLRKDTQTVFALNLHLMGRTVEEVDQVVKRDILEYDAWQESVVAAR